jgi:hypothetical protein
MEVCSACLPTDAGHSDRGLPLSLCSLSACLCLSCALQTLVFVPVTARETTNTLLGDQDPGSSFTAGPTMAANLLMLYDGGLGTHRPQTVCDSLAR